jgi:hypothetical protein
MHLHARQDRLYQLARNVRLNDRPCLMDEAGEKVENARLNRLVGLVKTAGVVTCVSTASQSAMRSER